MLSTSESWLAFVCVHTTGWATSWQGAAPARQGQLSGCRSSNGTLELSVEKDEEGFGEAEEDCLERFRTAHRARGADTLLGCCSCGAALALQARPAPPVPPTAMGQQQLGAPHSHGHHKQRQPSSWALLMGCSPAPTGWANNTGGNNSYSFLRSGSTDKPFSHDW